jgi:peptide-methionine (S)-S-oxide reductase
VDSLASLFERLPIGWSEASYDGRRYGVTRSVRLGGQVQSMYAEELGGTDVISANLYLPPGSDEQFRPCEMPAAKVRAFLEGWASVTFTG